MIDQELVERILSFDQEEFSSSNYVILMYSKLLNDDFYLIPKEEYRDKYKDKCCYLVQELKELFEMTDQEKVKIHLLKKQFSAKLLYDPKDIELARRIDGPKIPKGNTSKWVARTYSKPENIELPDSWYEPEEGTDFVIQKVSKTKEVK